MSLNVFPGQNALSKFNVVSYHIPMVALSNNEVII